MSGTKIPFKNINEFLPSSDTIGVVLGKSSHNQLHCGVIFKSEGGFNMIHLAWHFCLLHETNYEKYDNYIWAKTSLHRIRQDMVSAMCRKILKRKFEQNIPYGLIYNGGKFTEDGIMDLDSTESGLTCATFVLAVFNSCKIQLIDTLSWTPRDEDASWHESIIASLIATKDKFNISEAHIDNLKKEVGCARFRPEEVTVSSSLNPIPSPNSEIIKSGIILKEHLLK